MSKRGGARPGSGRKEKVTEERIRDLTSPYIPGAIDCVINIMQNGEKDSDRLAAAKLMLAYHFGQPTQVVNAKVDGTPKIIFQDISKEDVG
jgi:hypothetical protein